MVSKYMTILPGSTVAAPDPKPQSDMVTSLWSSSASLKNKIMVEIQNIHIKAEKNHGKFSSSQMDGEKPTKYNLHIIVLVLAIRPTVDVTTTRTYSPFETIHLVS